MFLFFNSLNCSASICFADSKTFTLDFPNNQFILAEDDFEYVELHVDEITRTIHGVGTDNQFGKREYLVIGDKFVLMNW